MKDLLLLSVKRFLEERLKPNQPLIIGYSGGPDSKALLYLLLDCRRFFPLDLHLAHIDHSWRPESRQEAMDLQAEAKKLALPFHLHTLAKEDFTQGNFEEQGRNFRLNFFSKIYAQGGFQALLLGHHADDQAEVVLKRVFEGASLFSLGGLIEDRQIRGMNIWRPLLGVSKKTVLEWLERRNISFIEDPTNVSMLNLRGRMRKEILPFLKNSFRKEISNNLCWLAEESQQLKEYFSALNAPILDAIKRQECHLCLDLNPFLPMPALQLKYLIKELFHVEGCVLSRQLMENIVEALLEGEGGKKFITQKMHFQVEHGFLYLNKR